MSRIAARTTTTLVAVIALLLAGPALALDAWLSVDEGLVTARFSATPGSEVRDAIHATGLDVQMPASASGNLTLVVDRVPLEHFFRRLADAYGLGGFALVYDPDGTPVRAVVVEKGHGASVAGTHSPTGTTSHVPPRARHRPVLSVPVVFDAREARSMKLGTPGQVLIVQAPSMGTARTDACGAPEGAYPVQTVLVTDGSNTYVTSIVVCRADALPTGETLGLSPAAGTESGSRSRFMATTQ